jgi:hypothetical protein
MKPLIPALAASIAFAACGGGGGSDSQPGSPGGPTSISDVLGTASQNRSLTIIGSSFGAKSHAGPMLYDDFDDGTSGNIDGRKPQIHQGHLSHYSSWQRTAVGPGSIPQILRDNSDPKTGSSHHARMEFNGDYWSLYLTVDLVHYFTTGPGDVYSPSGIATARRARITQGRPRPGLPIPGSVPTRLIGPLPSIRANQAAGGCIAPMDSATHLFGMSGQEVENEWIRVDTYLKQSGPGIATGHGCRLFIGQIRRGG